MLGVLKRLRPYVPTDSLITIYNSIVLTQLDYCCEVWDSLGKTLSDKLQKFQNRAARLILGTDNRTSSNLVLGLLEWDRIDERRAKRKAIAMHKAYYNSAPESVVELFQTVESSTNYNLRGGGTRLVLPRPSIETFKKSFPFSGAKVWNSLPDVLRQTESLESFKNKLRSVTLLDNK